MTAGSDIISPVVVARWIFWLMTSITVAGALLAVVPRNIVHNILGLALSMLGITGIYLFLGSQFVAMMQLLIYVGAICMTYIFAIMLSPPLELELPKRRAIKVAASVTVSTVCFAVMTQMILKTDWGPAAEISRDWSIKTLGQQLLTRYFLVFETISLLLAIAIIGAIMIAGLVRRKN
jgi:NADH-quinone oxidoreductase subunit J